MKPNELKIVNILTRMHIKKPFSLSQLASKMNLSSLPSHMKHYSFTFPPVKFFLFPSTGKILSFAAPSFEVLKKSISLLYQHLSTFDIQLSDKYETLNIVAVFKLPFFDIDLLALSLFLNASYDVEARAFPSIIYHPPSKKASFTAMIFSSGKVVLTGVSNAADLYDFASSLTSLVSNYFQARCVSLK